MHPAGSAGTRRVRWRERTRDVLAVSLGLGLVMSVTPAAAHQPDGEAHPEKVDQRVRAQLAQLPSRSADASVEVLVVLDTAAEAPAAEAARAAQQTGEVVPALREHAQRSQRPVRETLARNGDTLTRGYWLKNMVLAEVAPETVSGLTRLDEVERIIPNLTLSIPEDPHTPAGPGPDRSDATPSQAPETDSGSETDSETDSDSGADSYTWGLDRIGADRVHQELGLTGDGVRVAVLDTGVDITHPDLAGRMVTTDPDDPTFPGGWMELDATGEPVASQPHDSEDHGTHVAGTVMGDDASGTQIGVAPDAELMAGLVLPGGEGTLAQVIAGMEWAADPYDAQGNPAGEPADIVNMSLGAVGRHDELIAPTRNLVAAGIFPSFSAGNNCFGSSSSPGNVYEAVGVGATDEADDVASFSCGELVQRSDWNDPPADWPESYVVPDVAAPGVGILSAYPGGDWRSISGTSMAAPHVSGTVALMRQAAGAAVSVDELRSALTGTTYFDDRYGERPNPRWGSGRIDAYHAVLDLGYDSGVTGTITDAATGAPVAGATVTRVDNGFSVRTDDSGEYDLPAPAGSYDLSVERFGYEDGEIDDVEVSDGTETTVDFELTPLPRHTVSGTITFDGGDTTIPGATVRVVDAPDPLTATSRVSGRYTLTDVPEGTHLVEAYVPGLPPSAPIEVELSGGGAVRNVDPVVPAPGATRLVSVGHDGTGADDYSIVPTVSNDGRYVAFRSVASNLVPDDTNGNSDVFVRDLVTGHTERVSVSSDGTEGQGSGPFLLYPAMSDDSRYVVWDDDAYNLVEGDDNQTYDVFLHDRHRGTTEMVSIASDGSYANDASLDPAISADGRFVVFRSHATNLGVDPRGQGQIYLHDRTDSETELLSVGVDGAAGDGFSSRPSVSADGRFVAFHSSATNLVDGDTNGQTDIFVADRIAGTIGRVSVASDGSVANGSSQYPVISDDGRHVTFHSGADNLVDDDTNSRRDVFVHDRDTGRTVRASVATDGTGGNGNSHYPSINAAGTHATFYSAADNLVDDDTNGESDVFVHDLRSGITERVSVAADGSEGAGYAQGASLSRDAAVATFHSEAPDLVAHDRNGQTDIFTRHQSASGDQARFVAWNLRAVPDEVAVGRSVLVRAWVKNIGDAGGEYRAGLRLDGRVVDPAEVTLNAGTMRMLTFRVRLEQPGQHELRLGDLTTTVVAG